jgi:hypothetical protein
MESRHGISKKYLARFLWAALIPAALLIKWLFGLSPSFVERVYSQGVYPVFTVPLSRLTGLIPVSLWEMSVIFLIVFIPARIVTLVIKAVKTKRLSVFVPFLANVTAVVSIWFFLQNVLWNINYERLPFADSANLEVRDSSVDELHDLCSWLIDGTNSLRTRVQEDDNGVMTIPGGFRSIRQRAQLGYDAAALEYPMLRGKYGAPKSVIFSRIMSHTNIIGMYAVLAGEASIDTDIPVFEIPSTVMHEMAHQRGFAREDEANYIAWVTCMAHPDPDFKYSGSVMALQYAMNALYGANRDKYYELTKKYGPGIIRDLNAQNQYWKQFQGPTKKVADRINDTYLKLNGEEDGVKSYGRMVDLLLAEYRKTMGAPALP